MKAFKPKAVSFILCFALIITLSFIPVTVHAADGDMTFADSDADHVYFGEDTFKMSVAASLLVPGTPVDAEFYLYDPNTSASTPAAVLTGCNSVYKISCDTDTTGIIKVSGTITNNLSAMPLGIGVKYYNHTTNIALSDTIYPVRVGSTAAVVGLDSIFDNFPTKANTTNGFFVNDEFNRDQSFNLGAANVTFSMIINYPAPSEEEEIIGSMSFTNLNMLDATSMMQLGQLANSITMAALTAGAGYEDEFRMGLDTSQTTFLASIGASLSLKDPGFNGSAGSNFTIAQGDGQTGTASAISFNDTTDTLTFDVSHFSDYKISRTASGDGGGGGGGDGGGSGGGSGSGGNQQTPPPPTPTSTLKGNTMTSSVTLAGAQDAATGRTTASVTKETFAPMIEKAKTAETAGQKPVVEIKVDSASTAKEVEVDIPKTSFNQLADQTKAQVSVTSSLGTVIFDEAAVQAISEKAGGDIQISMAKVDTAGLSSDIRALVGDAPVYDFTVQSGSSKISDFEGGSANISVPYTLKEGDDPNAVVVYYISDSGALETVRGAYDPDTKTVAFVTEHFSKYALAYNEVAFGDVADSAWYNDAVGFIAARGITTGTDKNHFSPNAKLTRAQFLVMVMKAYGIEPAADPADNFADAGGAYYTAYLAKAKELGLANGDGNNLFGPNRNITRQDMFTLLYRTLDLIDEVPDAAGSTALSDFLDAGSINAYAKTPMEALVAAGVVTGSNDLLTPKNTTTRAEMAQVLFNLLSK